MWTDDRYLAVLIITWKASMVDVRVRGLYSMRPIMVMIRSTTSARLLIQLQVWSIYAAVFTSITITADPTMKAMSS